MTTTEFTDCCLPGVRAPIERCFKPCIRPDWFNAPGFWNPHEVTEVCLSVLARSVYSATRTMQMERASLHEPCGRRVPDGDICRGITMYTEPWQKEDCIETAVQRFITFPCKMELVEAIDMKPERALAILLTYFKYRGPFLTYVYRGKDSANIIGRFLPRTVLAFLNQLPDFEMSAAVAIGRHLSHLLRIAYGHRLMDFRKNLATVWGPVYLKVETATDAKPPIFMSECAKFEAAVEIFSRMLENVPWHTVTPFQGVSLSMTPAPSANSTYATISKVHNGCLQELMQEPSICKGTLADIMHSQVKAAEDIKDKFMAVCGGKTEEKKKKDAVCHSPQGPEDNCNLSYGARVHLTSKAKLL